MKKERGIAMGGMLLWSIVLVLVAVLGMKVVPNYLEYYKILNGAKATAAKAAPESTVADIRKTFDKYAEVDHLDFKGTDLDISKDGGKVVIDFAYERRVPLFWNVTLLIDFKGSTAGR